MHKFLSRLRVCALLCLSASLPLTAISQPLFPDETAAEKQLSDETAAEKQFADVPTSANGTATDSNSLPQEAHAKIAIIIDDLGYSLRNGLRAARMPAELTLAVLPHTPNGAALARLGHRQGKEIMLHNPMASTQPVRLDKGALTGEMDQTTFVAMLRENLAAVPHIRGLNNHMGSQLTQNPQAMAWLMSELKQQGLFFIDSRTSADSLAFDTALEHQLPSSSRDVFLDHDKDPAQIARQFDYLLQLAREKGRALAIGHPYPATLTLLEQRLPELAAEGIVLVPVSTLLNIHEPKLGQQPSLKTLSPQLN